MTDLFILFLLLLLSGIFSGSETALVSLSMARAEALAKGGRRGAKALFELKGDPARMLITILIGNNVVNIAASALATVIATQRFGHVGPGIAVGLLTVLILVFGEITPKSLATKYSERISLFIAPIMLGFMRLVSPVVWLFEQLTTWLGQSVGASGDPIVTESELITLAEHGEEEGTIESGERELIERVFDFTDLKVADAMTPVNRVFALDGRRQITEMLPEVLAQPFSRIPLFDEDPSEIVSILYMRDMLEAATQNRLDATAKSIAHVPLFCPQNQPIDELFATLRRKKRHMAIVVDEHGVLQGVVTLEDLVEELVGEIYDESDELPQEFAELSGHRILVDGAAELRVVENYFDIELPGKPTDTVSRWMLSHTERIPEVDEQFELNGLSVIVQGASRRRIHQVILALQEVGETEDFSGPTT